MRRLCARRPSRLGRLPYVTVVCAIAVAACGSPPTPTTIVTVAQARAVAQNYGRVDAQAAATCSATLNDTVEAGDLAAIDDGGDFNPAVCAVRGTPAPPSPSATPSPITNNELVVPRATSYPAFFFEYIDTDTGNGDGQQPNLYVLESNKRGVPWKGRYQVELTSGGLLSFHRDAGGYAPALLGPSASGYQMTPAATCDAAADYFEAAYSGASTPSRLSDPSHIATSPSGYRSDDAQMFAQHDVVSSRAWACAGAEVAEPTKAGDALVIFTLRGAYTFTVPTGKTFWLNTAYSGGKTVQLLDPGYYKAASATELFILAALVPKHRSSATPRFIGLYRGVTAVTSTPADA